MYSRILKFHSFPVMAMHTQISGLGLYFFDLKKNPDDGTPVPKHVGD
jgi:hypothetical protein